MRTPLNTLSGLLELFDLKFSEGLPQTAKDYLATMINAVDHMTHLTETLLDHAISLNVDTALAAPQSGVGSARSCSVTNANLSARSTSSS